MKVRVIPVDIVIVGIRGLGLIESDGKWELGGYLAVVRLYRVTMARTGVRLPHLKRGEGRREERGKILKKRPRVTQLWMRAVSYLDFSIVRFFLSLFPSLPFSFSLGRFRAGKIARGFGVGAS